MNKSCYLLSCLHYWFKIIYIVELHESIQESQSNNDSDTDDMLILVLQKFEEDKELCLGNDYKNNKTDKILYKKQN